MKPFERTYKAKLIRMVRAADRMLDLDDEDFDSREAMKLVDGYHSLTTDIYEDSRLTDPEKDSWGTAFSHCYDVPFSGLVLRGLAKRAA